MRKLRSKKILFRFLTTWALWFELCIGSFVIICTLRQRVNAVVASAALAAVSNTLAIGLTGPFIAAYGKPAFECDDLMQSNALLHTAPAYVALVYLLFWKEMMRNAIPHPSTALWLVGLLDVSYLLVPYDDVVLAEKVRVVYGVSMPVAWIASFAFFECGTIYAIAWRVKKSMTPRAVIVDVGKMA